MRRFNIILVMLFWFSAAAYAVDTDGDGFDDSVDAFPNDPTEWYDTDMDGIGNNADTDDDGDGIPDTADNNNDGDPVIDLYDPFPEDPNEWLDTDADGVGNNADTDDDNDGVLDVNDVFPLNPNETIDTDADTIGNNTDSDDDGDGVIDVYDLFPLDSTEWLDTDGDGVGNNADSDDDNDGFVDSDDDFVLDVNEWIDTDGDGTGNNADGDDDNDGVADSDDAFRLDAAESVDTDGDLVGNNADSDDDNDGFVDAMDDFPLNAAEWLDTDGDTIGNNADTDDDNDGVQDNLDLFPLNPAESRDDDNDGIGNNADADDDNDGVLDVDDAFPLDPSEYQDTDNDGIGNVLDIDDDGDGVLDNVDLFPLNPNESRDDDNDGLGNNEDSDDDNDGVLDVDDAFPLDPVEQYDTDNDGIGNVYDTDDDGDGVLDYLDDLPLDPTETTDTDGDGLGNNADPDDDNDGMSDDFELTYGFDPLDASDGDLDTDHDGVSNADEALANTNPLIDDYPPVITPPSAINIDADHTFTLVNLDDVLAMTTVSASDGLDGPNCCQPEALGFEQGVKSFSSGQHKILWRAVDNAGNIAEIEQVVNVHPLVNFSQSQLVAEGSSARVEVLLSGVAPSYPLNIPFVLSGSSDELDYDINASQIIIEEGVYGFIDIDLLDDFQSEADEELILSFNPTVNAGNNDRHILTVTENNVAPQAVLELKQQAMTVSSIAKDKGEAVITLTLKDTNPDDSHIIDWALPDYLNAELSANQLNVFLDPEQISLPAEAGRLIRLSVTVTDSGTGQLSQQEFMAILLLDSLPRLTDTDTDRDGIIDSEEGFADNDGDGLPAFMDTSEIPYVQQLHVNSAQNKLVETEPGLSLSLGSYARLQYGDGIQLSQQEINDTGLITADELTHSNEYFDFNIKGVSPYGNSAFVVIPLLEAIPEYSVYRKFSKQNGWQSFVVDSKNAIASSPAINGVCPPYHSDHYQDGLNTSDVCLRLMIEDGGANDADGIANGTIDDPGGIAVIANEDVAKETDPEKSSSGSMFYLTLLLLLILSRRFLLIIKSE